ncbi:uncharacterized protein METZ01_LOCUS478503, partial [marine metagenome]
MKGFLPIINPIRDYSVTSLALERLNETARNLPKLLLTNRITRTIDSLKRKDFSVDKLIIKKEDKDLRLAMVQLSFIAHAYIWGGNKPREKVPEVIAKPWVQIAELLGRPPIMSYASYCLDNWFLIDKKEPISLENVGLIT